MIIGIRPITDHGGFGSSLLDDDHPQYFKADGSRNLTGALVTSNGGFRPVTNGSTAISLQQEDGTAVLNVDTTNFWLGLRCTPGYEWTFSGNATRKIGMLRHATVSSPGQSLTMAAGGPRLNQNNLSGGNLYLSAGLSTGTGESAVELQTATAGVSGSADNTPTTKLKILGNKIAFFYGSTPAAQQTLGAYTSDAESGAYTGIDNAQVGSVYAQLADLNTLRVAYDNLRASYDDLRTKLLATTLILTA